MNDIEKIKAEIERLKKETLNGGTFVEGFAIREFNRLLSFIDSLEKEQPKGLDDAAELSANGAVISRQSSIDGRVVYNLKEKCFDYSDLIKQFKLGAKWMAEQGEKFIRKEER